MPGVYEQPVIQLDLHAEVKPADDWKLDGVNLLPYLSGEISEPPHEALYWRFGQQMAIRQGDFKLVRYDINAETSTGRANPNVTELKLYNLREDIGESKDLAATMPEKVKELQARWDAWDKRNVRPL